MNFQKRLLVTLLLIGPLANLAADRVILAVPARHDLVNLGFDFVGMFPRALEFVCYDGAGESLQLERFDTGAGRWMALPRNAWSSLNADNLVLVGEGASVDALKQAAVWARQSAVVDGRRLHEVANAMNDFLRLTPAQWTRLSNAYGFTLEDRNVEARRHGRYGPPSARIHQWFVEPLNTPLPVTPAPPVMAPISRDVETTAAPIVDLAPVNAVVPAPPLQPEIIFQAEPQPRRPEIRPEDK